MEKCLVQKILSTWRLHMVGRPDRASPSLLHECCVDDLWNQITQGKRIRQGGFTPSLSVAQSNYNGDCRRISGYRYSSRNLVRLATCRRRCFAP